MEGNRREPLGALEVAFLRGRQERMQHLDRRLEHLDELEQPLVGQAQAARIAVRVGIVLGKVLELADVDLAHQRGDVLVVLVARLGLGDGDLAKHRGVQAHHAELRDVALELGQALDGPRAHEPGEIAPGDAELPLEGLAVAFGLEQAQRRFVDRRALERIDGVLLHQRLEPFGDRGLAAADRPEQVEHLLAFLESLRRMAEVGDDLGDRVLHAVELLERRIAADHPVREEPRQARIMACIDDFRLADRREHPLGRARIGKRVAAAEIQVLHQGHLLLARLCEGSLIALEQVHVVTSRGTTSEVSEPGCTHAAPAWRGRHASGWCVEGAGGTPASGKRVKEGLSTTICIVSLGAAPAGLCARSALGVHPRWRIVICPVLVGYVAECIAVSDDLRCTLCKASVPSTQSTKRSCAGFR